ncbi:MAG: thermonuclease family protein [Proteobacteria bacterium]|nr:thermonuclease family protein [Pseudomonadota bacterium]
MKPRIEIVCLAGALSLFWSVASASAEKVTGIAEVISGDKLRIAGTTFHLRGIRAVPEGETCGTAAQNWRCGWSSINALANFVGRHWITCTVSPSNSARIKSAECFAGPTSINRWMVTQGWARADTPADAIYRENEVEARRSRRGIWGDAPPALRRSPGTP